MAAVLKSVDPRIWVVGCQPAASDVMRASVAAGCILDQPSGETLSDGSAGGVVRAVVWWPPCILEALECRLSQDAVITIVTVSQERGALTFEPCRRFVDDWVTVTEPEIAAAMLGGRDHHGGMLLEGVSGFRLFLSMHVTLYHVSACDRGPSDAAHTHISDAPMGW